MKINRSTCFGITVITSMLCAFNTIAGEKIGNGGGGIICRDAKNSIVRSQTLDLYELEKEFNGVIDPSINPASSAFAIVRERLQRLRRIEPKLHHRNSLGLLQWHIVGLIERVIEKQNYKNQIELTSETLPKSGDAYNRLAGDDLHCPEGTSNYEQAINYFDAVDGRIENIFLKIQEEIFISLSNIDRAALIVHEIVYAYQRTKGEVDSIKTRRIVGLIFSSGSDLEIQQEITLLLDEGSVWGPDYEIESRQMFHLKTPNECKQSESGGQKSTNQMVQVSVFGEFSFEYLDQMFRTANSFDPNILGVGRHALFLSAITQTYDHEAKKSYHQIKEDLPCKYNPFFPVLSKRSLRFIEIVDQNHLLVAKSMRRQSQLDIKRSYNSARYRKKDYFRGRNMIGAEKINNEFTTFCLSQECTTLSYKILLLVVPTLVEKEELKVSNIPVMTKYRLYKLTPENRFNW